MNTCLIISPHFPPSTLAGVHRARHLVKHLPAHGWGARVVCVDPKFHTERLDPALADLVPLNAPIIRVGALPVRMTRPFGIAGDIGLRGFWHIRRAIAREMQTVPPSVVLITGSPYYPMLLTNWIERRWQTPVILDFQDPWVSHWGGRQPLFSKAGLSHALALALEPRVLRGASFVTSVSYNHNAELVSRYSWLDPERMDAIPIGGDREDFSHLRRAASREGSHLIDRVELSFVGTVMPRSGPLIRLVLMALDRLRREYPAIGGRIRLNFIGTSNQPDDATTFRVLPIAEEIGVADLVYEVPRRLPYLQALSALAESDGILLIGSDEPHYTASKIYPGLMSGRPFLSFFHQASSSHAILSRAGGGISIAYSEDNRVEDTILSLMSALQRIATEADTIGIVDPSVYAPYEATAIAQQYARIFDKVAAVGPRRRFGSAFSPTTWKN